MKILVNDKIWQDAINEHTHHEAYSHDLSISTEQLAEYCQQNKIDAIVCSSYQTILCHLKTNSPALRLLPWLIPSQHACLMEDKCYGHQWFIKHDYAPYLPPEKEPSDFPYLIKIPGNLSGKLVYYINDQSDLNKHLPLPKHHLLQAYIHTPYEYVYHFLAHKGKVLEAVTYQHDFTQAYANKSHYIRGYRIRNDKSITVDLASYHEMLFHQIIQQLDFNGLGCFDFKLYEDRLYILEMNSRMGGSLIFYPNHSVDFDRFLLAYIDLI